MPKRPPKAFGHYFSIARGAHDPPLLDSLPDIHPLVRRPDHWAGGGNVKRLGELLHVRDRSDGAETAGRMRIRFQPQLQIFVALIVSPDLRPTQEETLVRRKPIDLL